MQANEQTSFLQELSNASNEIMPCADVSEVSIAPFLNVTQLPYAYGTPNVTGMLNKASSDFTVEEVLKFAPSGAGEHIYLYVQKENANTEWVARNLAKFVKVPQRDVSFAGLKDRHGLTSQWFSIRMPKATPIDWETFSLEGVKILKTARHDKKLRKDAISYNRFKIQLRQIKDEQGELEKRLALCVKGGFPNYFGEQRFGHDNQNLVNATKWFLKEIKFPARHLVGIYLSAVRGYLFNQVLSKRISMQWWNKAILGDVMMLNGTHSFFVQNEDTGLAQSALRIEKQDIHQSGPLYGVETPSSLGEVLEIENAVSQNHPILMQGLVKNKLATARRALRAIPMELHYSISENNCYIEFNLGSGSYATMFLRELIRIENAYIGD